MNKYLVKISENQPSRPISDRSFLNPTALGLTGAVVGATHPFYKNQSLLQKISRIPKEGLIGGAVGYGMAKGIHLLIDKPRAE